MIDHRQPKLILRNLQNVGHYKTLYWGFAHFLKIVEYCYYCGNKVYLTSVHFVLVCCAQLLLSAIPGVFEGENRGGKFGEISPLDFLPQILNTARFKRRAWVMSNQTELSSRGGGGYFLIVKGYWGCAAGWGRIFTTGLTIMGLHF